MQIDWQPPTPRAGLEGALDRFIGPGATRAEIVLQFCLAVAIAVAALAAFLLTRGGETHIFALIVLFVVAFDMGGGIATNSTAAAKRWYHRHGQGPRQHLQFVAIHGLHILVMALLFAPSPWLYCAVFYGGLLVGAAIIVVTPLYLQRTVALSLVGLSVIVATLPPLDAPGLIWLPPLMALKLWASHLLKEAPYRP